MKKRMLLIVLSVVLVSAAAVGATLAYFSATATADNTFTVGNVQIKLEEPRWTEAGSKDAPEVYPGEPLEKDPFVTNIGANPCVVRIKVDLPISGITFRNFDTTNWIDGGDGYYYYKFPLKSTIDTDPNNASLTVSTTKLFTHVVMPTSLTNGDASTDYDITVTAEAVQAQGIFPSFSSIRDGISTSELATVKTMFTNAFGY